MHSAKHLEDLRRRLPPAISPQVVTALYNDRLVKTALEDPAIFRLVLERSGDQVEDWTPAALSLLAAGVQRTSAELADPSLPALDAEQQKQALMVLEEVLRSGKSPRTLADAGWLALALRERRRRTASWNGLLSELTALPGADTDQIQDTWRTALVCLYGLVPDGVDLMKALLPKHDLQPSAGWISSMVFGNPLALSEQKNLFIELMVRLPMRLQVDWLVYLGSHGHAELAQQLAQLFLQNYENASLARDKAASQNLEDLQAEAMQSHALAALYQLAGHADDAVRLLDEAISRLDTWRASLHVQMAAAEVVLERPMSAAAHCETALDCLTSDATTGDQVARIALGAVPSATLIDRLDALQVPLVRLHRAWEAYRAGNLEAARESAREAVREYIEADHREPVIPVPAVLSHDLSAWLDRLSQMGLAQEAVDFGEHLLDKAGLDGTLLAELTRAAYKAGLVSRALDYAQQAVLLEPGSPDRYRQIARLWEALENWPRAAAERRSLLRLQAEPELEDQLAFIHAALQAGGSEEAEEICRRLLTEQPENGLIIAYNGMIAAARGEDEKAVQELSHATAILPDHPLPWVELSKAYRKVDQAEKALETLKAGVLAVPDSHELHFALAEECLRDGRTSEALPYLRRAFELAPDSPSIALVLAETLKALGHTREASSVLSEALRRHDHDANLYFLGAELRIEDGDLAEGVELMEKALALDSSRNEWHQAYAETLLALFAQQRSRPGIADYSLLAKAQTALQHILAVSPDDFMARLLMAETMLYRGHFDSAFNRFTQLMEVNSETAAAMSWRVNLGIGEASLGMNQIDTALVAFQAAAEERPDDVVVQQRLAEAYCQARFDNEAAEAAEKVKALAPGSLEILLWYADLMNRLDRPTKAEDALRRAIEMDSDRADLLVQLAAAQLRNENLPGAMESLSGMVYMADASAADLQQAAHLFHKLENYESEMLCYQRALEVEPEPPVSLMFEAACAMHRMGQDGQALEVINRAIYTEPNDVHLYLAQADLLTRLNRAQEAFSALENALRLQDSQSVIKIGPENDRYSNVWSALVPSAWRIGETTGIEVHLRFAYLLQQAGSYSLAQYHAEKALELEPRNLSVRFMAADLALAAQMPERALSLLEPAEVNLSGPGTTGTVFPGDRAVEQQATLLSLKAEMALEQGDLTKADQLVSQALTLNPETLRARAVRVRLSGMRGDINTALKTFKAFQEDLTKARSELREGTDLLRMLCRSYQLDPARGTWFVEAASSAFRWQQALEVLDLQAAASNLEPRELWSQITTRVRAAEFKARAAYLHSRSLVSESALSPEAHARIEQMLSTAETGFPADMVNRWTARAEAAFAPDVHSVQALTVWQKPEDLAAQALAMHRAAMPVDYEDLIERSDYNPEVLAQLVLKALDDRQDQYYELANQLLDRAPGNPLWHALYARVMEALGDYEVAFDAVETALSMLPEEIGWHTWAAELAEQAGILDSAIQHWTQVTRMEPECVEHTYRLGCAFLRMGDYQQAEDMLLQVLKTDPDYVDALIALAKTYQRSGDLQQALNTIDRAARLEKSGQVLTLMGEIYMDLGDLQQGLSCANQALEQDELYAPAILLKARVLQRMDKPSQAQLVLDKALKALPDDEDLNYEQARLVYQKEGALRAKSALEGLSQRFPNHPGILYLLAMAEAETGELEAAEATAKRSLRLDPVQPDLHLLLGHARRRAGQLDQAVYHFSQAVQQAPEDVEGYLELGKAYQDRREYAEANYVFQQAIEVAPDDYRPYYLAALAMRDAKDYQNAEKLLRQAAKLAPHDLNIRRQLGAVIALNLVHHSQEANSCQ